MSQIPNVGASSPVRTAENDLRDVDMDQFLQLLIAELQNQDPLSPMENSELIAQIGQIREIGATNLLTETLTNVQNGQNLATASGLIGKQVDALTDDNRNVQGKVDRVSIEVNDDGDRNLRVHIGEDTIALKNIRAIT